MLSRRWILLLIFIALIAAVGIASRYLPDAAWVVDQEQSLRGRVATDPIRSWLVGLIVYWLLSLVPGTAGKSVVCGWLFGFWPAVLMVELGLTAAAVTCFMASRVALSHWVYARWPRKLKILKGWIQREGAFVLVTLRLLHVPFTLVNYGAGAMRISLPTFWWTTHVGILPGTLVFTFVGTRIPSLQVIAENGVWSLLDGHLIAALLISAIVPLIVRMIVLSNATTQRELRQLNEFK